MVELIPNAKYESPNLKQEFSPGEGPHSTDGKTTGISDIVTNAGGIDKDKPSEAKDTELGALRARLTSLQDEVNVFLTDRMKQVGGKDQDQIEQDLERRVLDDGVDEDDED